MSIPTFEEFERIMIERHTKPVYDRLKNASVAIAGLGGLGSNIAVSLARAGVGTLFLTDFDRVDLSNLNRQQYTVNDIGRYKTEALADLLHNINPYLNISYETKRITEDNAAATFAPYDIVCEAFDRADMKALLINALLESDPDKIIISGSGMAGALSSNTIKTRCAFAGLYICGDGVTDIADANGLMAPRVAICANHQANMAVRIILGMTDV